LRRGVLEIVYSEWLEVKNNIPIDTSVTPGLCNSVIVIGCELDDQCLIPWAEMFVAAVAAPIQPLIQ
jgi:hypothetical protein